MKNFIGFCCTILLILNSIAARAQQPEIVKFDELARMMDSRADTTYIFNFFATWCAPCVEEFPYFQRVARECAPWRVKLVFVSLDFRKDYQTRLLPFLTKRHVKDEAVLLDETDYNAWIDRVDSSWDGNLPATLVVNNQNHVHKMFAQEFTYESLIAALRPILLLP